MTTNTAVANVERYVMMLEKGAATKAARTRYYRAMGYLHENANYMHYGKYAEYGLREEKYKREEAENGADITPMSEVLKRRRASI